ncbi:MAG: helix-turn-helix transcriptional regulator [Bacteroidales bacterium]|jgi:LuxR family maltose regulon positive regulatory protein|nr:helix-turn-helix transcriptional regulator [Bacteroidales bacterium]
MNKLHGLSDHEEKIMLLIKGGLINKEIASVLERSPDTVKYHLKKIYKKLGAGNRVEAINRFNETIKIKR